MEKKEKRSLQSKVPEIVLDEWQRQALEHEGNLLLCTGRQVGKTYILSRKSAERMVKVPNTQILVGSLTEDQAKLIIVMTQKYLEEYYPTWLRVKKKDKPTLNKIVLTNGSSMLARPVGNTGDSLRGFTGNVFVMDELSRWSELALIAGLPTLMTTGGEIWGASTPFGKQGFFWDAFQNKENYWKVLHVSSEEAILNREINENWTQQRKDAALRFLEQQKAQMSDLEYAQEYLGQFVDELRRYFSDEIIDQACTEKRGNSVLKGREYFCGVDIARLGQDESSFEIIDRINKETLQHVESQITRKQLTTQTYEKIISLDTIYNFKKIFIDAGAGSLGVGIFDQLINNDQTKRKVEAINNRKIVMDREGKSRQRLLKEDLYDNLLSLMQKQQIKLLDDENVRLSLRSVQYEYLKKANQISQMRIFGNYTHIVEGLIRAAWCSKEKNINMKIYSFKI